MSNVSALVLTLGGISTLWMCPQRNSSLAQSEEAFIVLSTTGDGEELTPPSEIQVVLVT